MKLTYYGYLQLIVSLLVEATGLPIDEATTKDAEGRVLRGQMNGLGHSGGGMGQHDQGGVHGGSNKDSMQIIRNLVENRADIVRTVEPPEGDQPLKTVTTSRSGDPKVADWIKLHVAQMRDLMEAGRRIRNWDPLFEEIFDHNEDLDITIFEMDDGVEVWLDGDTKCAKALSQNHADVISAFLENGEQELRRSHTPPPICR
jgi:hypothetical protein